MTRHERIVLDLRGGPRDGSRRDLGESTDGRWPAEYFVPRWPPTPGETIGSGHLGVSGSVGHAGGVGHMPIRPGGRRCQCGARGCWETNRVVLAGLFEHVLELAGPEILESVEAHSIDVVRAVADIVPSALGPDALLAAAAELAFEPRLADPAATLARVR